MDQLAEMLAALDTYTDAQLVALAHNIDDGAAIPGIGWQQDGCCVLLDRAAFIAFLRREEPADAS